MAEKLNEMKTLEGVVVESVGVGVGGSFTVVAVPEEPPPPLNPDDAVKAACERAAGGGREEREEEGGESSKKASPGTNSDWLARLAQADARISASAAAADAAVKQRLGDCPSSSSSEEKHK